MKIERINDNQIRCTLTSSDLSVRNLNLGELAYGSEKARNLFREMIQKASNEVGFEAEDIPLMVEAIPLSNESVMLVITKIEDPEELDTRFSKFSPLSDELAPFPLGEQEIKICYLLRARMGNKAISLLFNILPVSVIKAKQRIKNKIGLSSTDGLDKYIQQR